MLKSATFTRMQRAAAAAKGFSTPPTARLPDKEGRALPDAYNVPESWFDLIDAVDAEPCAGRVQGRIPPLKGMCTKPLISPAAVASEAWTAGRAEASGGRSTR
jgi:hypothetical protein